MKLCFLICCLMITANFHAQVITSLDNRVSISMPSAQKPTDSGGNDLWFFSFNDSVGISDMAMSIDCSKLDLDSATIALNYDSPEFV